MKAVNLCLGLFFILIPVLIPSAFCGYIVNSSNVLQYVNPLIGTMGEGWGIGQTPPGPQVPFGLVRLGPDTSSYEYLWIPWAHNGGYYYADDNIRVFSHTHLVGAGVVDFGNIAMMPITTNQINSLLLFNDGYRSHFTHNNEIVQAGYYSVLLDDWDIYVELTATKHVGIHRYTYLSSLPFNQGSKSPFILFPISHALYQDSTLGWQACIDSSVTINATAQEVTGYILNSGSFTGRIGGVTVYFVARFNQTFSSIGTWKDYIVSPGSSNTRGTNVGGYIQFNPSNPNANYVVEMYVGISFVSLENARLNLYTETNSLQSNFDAIKSQTQNTWSNILSQVSVQFPNDDQPGGYTDSLFKFYTSLYHTLLAPTTYTDVNGEYLGFDLKVHNIYSENPKQKAWYSDMSIWDVFRSEFPWLVAFQPNVMLDIFRSLVQMYQQGGDLPRWPLAHGYKTYY